MNENVRKWKNKYRSKVEELRVELYPTDGDIKDRIAERVAAGEPKATYIKRLIREDIYKEKQSEQVQAFIAKQFGLPLSVLQGKKDGANDENN